ncbi:hypothetical protein PACTADRAFT_56616 [Pachysolen tannophilus NRRL Y-2460]|uniref:Serine/threonine-protein kinase RIO2 n=1 Tax=Pachysolen tannophilus NRRL Y-2460 TaxID=669874 RepID=A0A1E4TW91_PACTA|nr:hypothetical protein PACTADRAFT_56616 [Pachysolen tannophilus NRRL Y-2460]
MKLDTSHMRYLTADDFRVLMAVELGSRNHEVVPTKMIHQIGGLKSLSGTNRAISDLAKLSLISKLRNSKYDGYRLSYSGYDYLAIKSMLNRKSLDSVGTTIGVGKESDIYSIHDPEGVEKVMKIHRLGRTSFKTVKNNRDYLKQKQSGNWMYLSRLAANKEYQFMIALYNNNFSVPRPFDNSRHCVIMDLINGFPMRQLKEHNNYKKLYSDLMEFIVKLGNHGLIHCDFNEFNIIIRNPEDNGKFDKDFVVIDFPQCISIDHVDASQYFIRDVECIRKFFRKRFNYSPRVDSTMLDTDGYGEGYKYPYPVFERDVKRVAELDVEVQASGFIKKGKNNRNISQDDEDLEAAVSNMRIHNDEDNDEDEEEDDQSDYDPEEYDQEDSDFSDEENEVADEENEKIIEALTAGKELKMDKFGNYILDEENN